VAYVKNLPGEPIAPPSNPVNEAQATRLPWFDPNVHLEDLVQLGNKRCPKPGLKGAAASPTWTITYEKLETIRVPTPLMPGDQDLHTTPWVTRRQLPHIPGAKFIRTR
jgi:hypothetical protein